MFEFLDRADAGRRLGQRLAGLRGRDVVVLGVVDDGIATGSTARVACQVARQLGAARVVLAVPVAPARAIPSLKEADDVVCLATPRNFRAVGYYYYDFSGTEDDVVVRLLDDAGRRLRLVRGTSGQHGITGQEDMVRDEGAEEEVEIPAGAVRLNGSLYRPPGCEGMVIFAHGSGSSRHSPRNRYVASVLHDAGLGTLLLDLLTPEEEVGRSNVFDIALLAQRLGSATRWLESRQDGWQGRIGYFGASTGAGAALWAAAEPDADIAAVVSRGGRPDLAGARLASVRAPTLLVVGGSDPQVLALNREAQSLLRATTRLEIVPGATHLFEEPGTLARAAELAAGWFSHCLLNPSDGNAGREVQQ